MVPLSIYVWICRFNDDQWPVIHIDTKIIIKKRDNVSLSYYLFLGNQINHWHLRFAELLRLNYHYLLGLYKCVFVFSFYLFDMSHGFWQKQMVPSKPVTISVQALYLSHRYSTALYRKSNIWQIEFPPYSTAYLTTNTKTNCLLQQESHTWLTALLHAGKSKHKIEKKTEVTIF